MSVDPNAVALAQRCLFGTAEHHCGLPATVHVLRPGGSGTMSCPVHVEWWAGQPDGYVDLHPIGEWCGVADAWWVFSGDDEPGVCVDPGAAT